MQKQTSILRKVIVQTIGTAALVATILTLLTFLVMRSLLQQQMYAQLSGLVHEKRQLIEQRIQNDRQRTALLAREENVAVSSTLRTLQDEGVSVMGIAVFSVDGRQTAAAGRTIDPPQEKVAATHLVPRFTGEGWNGYVVYTPYKRGILAMHYSVEEFLAPILSTLALGQTGEVTIGMVEDDTIVLLNHRFAEGFAAPLEVGNLKEYLQDNLPMAGALVHNGGTVASYDYDGEKVFAAYRSLPSLGWGLVVTVHQKEALRPIVYLAYILIAISVLLLAASAVIAVRLSKNLTQPIRALTKAMQKLGPDHWKLKRTTHTGDEVEILEEKAMSKRLKKLYDHLEEVIEERTEELKKQYLKDRTILQSIDYGVIMVNEKGLVTDANPAALEVLQCKVGECETRSIDDVLDVRSKDKRLRNTKHPVLRALSTGRTEKSEPEVRYSIMRSDNVLVPVLLTAKPLLDGKKLIGAVAVFQDITDIRRVDYLKSEFISLASHQLRTPLSSLQWYTEILAEEKDLSKEQKEYVKEMGIASKRMSELIDSLMHAARLESGSITPQTSDVNVTELIQDLADGLKSEAKQKKIACSIKIPKDKMRIHTDSVLLHVVCKNLFSNAVKYTKSGGTISVTMAKHSKHVELSVTDTGVGIPKREQKRLFQKLFRASNVRKMDTDGNGLGLYITKMIVEGLGGSIGIKSVEGKGTTVTVKLPMQHTK